MRIAGAPAQTISAERAAGFVTSDMWLDYGTSLCQPDVFDSALALRVIVSFRAGSRSKTRTNPPAASLR